MRPRREALALIAFLVVLGGGMTADRLADGVASASATAGSAATFEERGEYCPPGLRIGKVESKLVAASPTGEAVPVGLQPVLPQPLRLREGRLLVRRRTNSTGVDVVGHGAAVTAGSLSQYTSPVRGTSAVRCAPDASATWYFSEGSSEIGYDQRILLYNPFPAEAIVRITLFTPKGAQSKANLGEIAVHESSATAIALNDFVLREPVLGASVEVARGRVVAWSVLLVDVEGIEGAAATLGVEAPSTNWYFPNGEAREGVRQQISILNPTRDEASLTVYFVTGKGVVQPPKLTDLAVRGRTLKRLVVSDYLNESQRNAGAISAVVSSNNEVPVVAQQTLVYSTGGLQGIAAEIGAAAPAEHWSLAPPSTRPTSESITIFNPGSERAVASVTLVRTDRAPKNPDALQDIALKPGARIKLPILEFTKGAPMMAFVDATAPVVADRFAYSETDADVSAVGGERVRGSER